MPSPRLSVSQNNRASLHAVGLPQVPADRALEMVATEVIDRLHARPDAPGGAALGALSLQYLTLVQTQQAVRLYVYVCVRAAYNHKTHAYTPA